MRISDGSSDVCSSDLVPTDRYIRAGTWQGKAVTRLPVVRGLTGRRVGIYGLGAIGEKVAKRAAAFEMEIGYCNRRKRDDVAYAYFPTLLELATWADEIGRASCRARVCQSV